MDSADLKKFFVGKTFAWVAPFDKGFAFKLDADTFIWKGVIKADEWNGGERWREFGDFKIELLEVAPDSKKTILVNEDCSDAWGNIEDFVVETKNHFLYFRNKDTSGGPYSQETIESPTVRISNREGTNSRSMLYDLDMELIAFEENEQHVVSALWKPDFK